MNNILLTGATGFLGGEIAKRLLQKFPAARLHLLLRRQGEKTAAARLSGLLSAWNANTEQSARIQMVEGDLTSPCFGLGSENYETLAEQVDTVFHVAASVDLFGEYENLRRTNLGGTREVLRFAEMATRTGFGHLHYVSTAYVAGQRRGLVLESELDKGQTFNNAYERVKYEAEKEVEEAKNRLPLTVYRPGIIVGDTRTGWTPCFNVIYEPFRLFFAGRLPFLPGNRNSRLDLVPVDFVADAMVHLAMPGVNTSGKTFHLTAGPENCISPLALACAGKVVFEQVQQELGHKVNLTIPPQLHPALAIGLCRMFSCVVQKRLARMTEKCTTYSRYACYGKDFDIREAARLLEPAGILPPQPGNYLPVLLRFALEQNFGRRVPAATTHPNEPNPYSFKKISYASQS